MTKIRIVAAVVDTRRLTLYKENGETIQIPQGDPRLQRIINETKDVLLSGGVAEVDLNLENPVTTAYNDFEQKSGGLVRFFKVAKSKLAGLFGADTQEQAPEVEPVALGSEPALSRALGSMDKALSDIMAHAKPATDDSLKRDETVVAVVDNKPIVGAENLQRQFAHSTKMGNSTKGMEAFMTRIAKVIERRRHSVDDLLKFMEKGDLPIADDGSIIIYKLLNRHGDGYVDVHSGNVQQQIGSYVCMNENMVDPDRRKDCSNGLHVARRGYLGGFSGNVCVLAKVAPEDVIAVPQYDANKMRVCGYHILFELTPEMTKALKADMPMTSIPGGKELLARAISGDHPPAHEEVRIGGPKGTKVVVTPRMTNQPATIAKPMPAKEPETLSEIVEETLNREVEAIDISDPKTPPKAPPVDPKELSKAVAQHKKETAMAPTKPTTQKERITRLLAYIQDETKTVGSRMTAADDLIALRSMAKKSWKALGYPELTDELISMKAQVVSPGTKVTKDKPAKAQPMGNSRQDQFRMLYNQQRWEQLRKLKAKAKKGWDKLGFTPDEIAKIKENI